MTHYTKFIAVRIAKVGTVVICMVLRSQTWSTFRQTALCQCECISLIDGLSVWRDKSSHMTIACRMRLMIEWLSNKQ